MTSEESNSGCYQCGALDGTMLQLCAGCRDKNERERSSFKASLHVDTVGAKDPFFYKVSTLDRSNYLIALTAAVLLLGTAVGVGLVSGIQFGVIFVLLTVALSLLVVTVAGLVVVVEVARGVTICGLSVLTLLPPFGFVTAFLPTKFMHTLPTFRVIRTTLVAQVLGIVLLSSSIVAAKIVKIDIFKPKTYWRGASSSSSLSNFGGGLGEKFR